MSEQVISGKAIQTLSKTPTNLWKNSIELVKNAPEIAIKMAQEGLQVLIGALSEELINNLIKNMTNREVAGIPLADIVSGLVAMGLMGAVSHNIKGLSASLPAGAMGNWTKRLIKPLIGYIQDSGVLDKLKL